MDRNFITVRLNEKWLADITYVRAKGKFFYVAIVMELHSRRIIGWSVAEHMKTEIVLDALKHALKTRRNIAPERLLFHSDHGVHYASEEYRETLRTLNITQGISRKG